MKLHPTTTDGRLTVTGHAAGWIDIAGRRHRRSLLIMPDRVDDDWGPEPAEALDAAHLADLANRAGVTPGRILLLGTGGRQRFPVAAWLQPLIGRGIGIEIMDSGAACRTYNLLVAEGRDICAALVVEATASA